MRLRSLSIPTLLPTQLTSTELTSVGNPSPIQTKTNMTTITTITTIITTTTKTTTHTWLDQVLPDSRRHTSSNILEKTYKKRTCTCTTLIQIHIHVQVHLCINHTLLYYRVTKLKDKQTDKILFRLQLLVV